MRQVVRRSPTDDRKWREPLRRFRRIRCACSARDCSRMGIGPGWSSRFSVFGAYPKRGFAKVFPGLAVEEQSMLFQRKRQSVSLHLRSTVRESSRTLKRELQPGPTLLSLRHASGDARAPATGLTQTAHGVCLLLSPTPHYTVAIRFQAIRVLLYPTRNIPKSPAPRILPALCWGGCWVARRLPRIPGAACATRQTSPDWRRPGPSSRRDPLSG